MLDVPMISQGYGFNSNLKMLIINAENFVLISFIGI